MKNKYLKLAQKTTACALSAFVLSLPLLTQASELDLNSDEVKEVNGISDREIISNDGTNQDEVLIIDNDEESKVDENNVDENNAETELIALDDSKTLAKLNEEKTTVSYRDGKIDTSTSEYAQGEFDQEQFLAEAKKLGYSEANAKKIAETLKSESTKLVDEYVKSRYDALLEKYISLYNDGIVDADVANLSSAQELDDYVANKYSSWTKSRSQRVSEHIDACNTIAAVYSTNLSANYEAHIYNIKHVKSMLEGIPEEQLNEVNEIIAKLEAFDNEIIKPLIEAGAILDDFEKVDINYNPDSKIKDQINAAFSEQGKRKIKSLNDSLVPTAAKARSANSTITEELSFRSKIIEALFATWSQSPHPFYLNDTMRNVLPLLDAFAGDLEKDTPKEETTTTTTETTSKETETTTTTTETTSKETETSTTTTETTSKATEASTKISDTTTQTTSLNLNGGEVSNNTSNSTTNTTLTEASNKDTTNLETTESQNNSSKNITESQNLSSQAKDKSKSLPNTGEKENILTAGLLLLVGVLLLSKKQSILKKD